MTRQSNAYFTYTNPNPKNLKSAGDCVIRAVSLALNQDWQTTFSDLCTIAAKMCRIPNDDPVYRKYLETKGWIKNKQPRKDDNTWYTVREFLRMHPRGTYVISVSGHLLCAVDGKVLDTWDSSQHRMGVYYTKG